MANKVSPGMLARLQMPWSAARQKEGGEGTCLRLALCKVCTSVYQPVVITMCRAYRWQDMYPLQARSCIAPTATEHPSSKAATIGRFQNRKWDALKLESK